MYLTLPSNSSLKHFPENNASHFITQLAQPVDLSGDDYEVGLAEIQFRNTYRNVPLEECFFEYRYVKSATVDESSGDEELTWSSIKRVTVPGGLYESNSYFIHTLNKLVDTVLGHKKSGKSRLRFYYNRASKVTSFTIYERESTLKLSERLREILSLKRSFYHGGKTYVAKRPTDVNLDLKAIFVYCDLVRPRPVGDTSVPLLRTLPSAENSPDLVHVTYVKPHYIPVSRTAFSTIEIQLASDRGEELQFLNGHTTLTLHIRRRRPE